MPAAPARLLDDTQRISVARQLGANFGDRLAPSDLRRGRGAASNATGRFEIVQREEFDDGWERDEAIAPLKTEVTLRAPAHDHHAQRIARHFVRSLDQPLSRLRARLRLLLRAAEPRLSGPLRRARFREQAVRQGGRRRAAREGARRAEISPARHRARRQHRRLSADRAAISRDALDPRGAGARAPSRRHRHQVEPDPARSRSAGADGGAGPRQGVRLGHDARSRHRAKDGAARADAGAPAGGDRAARAAGRSRRRDGRRRSFRR